QAIITDNHLVYDAFGNILTQSDPFMEPRFGFTGYQYDGNTGLYYANARYYNANTGTFLVEDPKGFSAGQTNLYEYVGNNPLDFTDPTGMFGENNAGVGDLGFASLGLVSGLELQGNPAYNSATLDAF